MQKLKIILTVKEFKYRASEVVGLPLSSSSITKPISGTRSTRVQRPLMETLSARSSFDSAFIFSTMNALSTMMVVDR